MEEVDKEKEKQGYEEDEEIYEDEEDEIESLEDLKGEEGEEEVKKKLDRRRVKIDIPSNYPEIYLNESQVYRATKRQRTEHLKEFCTTTVTFNSFQRELITFVQQAGGFPTRMAFVRFAILKYARDEMKLIDAKRKTDIQFIKDYRKLRRAELIDQNNVKERIEKLKKMAPSQDEGKQPFTAEDLME